MSLLEKMQNEGPPKQGSHGPAAKSAVNLIVSVVGSMSAILTEDQRTAVQTAAKKIAERFMLDPEILAETKKKYCPKQDQFEMCWKAQLEKAGKDLAALLVKEAPHLLSLGLTAEQLGNASFKLKFTEIHKILNDPIFYEKEKLCSGRIAALLNSSNPRDLYSRLKSTYDYPELAELKFATRLFLVLNPVLAEGRVAFAREQIATGLSKGLLAAYTTATEEQISWFDEFRGKPGYSDSPQVLIRIAKQAPQNRQQLIAQVEELVEKGANHHDAITLVMTADYNPKIRSAALAALDLGLTSTAATTFALSENAAKAPTLFANYISELKALPLEWSDEMLVRMTVGSTFYKARPGSSPLQTKNDLMNGLKLNALCGFRIDRSDRLRYAARRMLSGMSHEEIIKFYGIYFNSRAIPNLRDTILAASDADKVAYTARVNGSKEHLRDAGIKAGKLKDPRFDAICIDLSDFLISINPYVRTEARSLFYNWLIEHAKKYYPKYMQISPTVTAEVVETTIRNYDPKSVQQDKSDRIGLYNAFSGNIRHFFSMLIKSSLKDSREGMRAYKLFVDTKTALRKKQDAQSDEQIWEDLETKRPDLASGISIARKEYERVMKIRATL